MRPPRPRGALVRAEDLIGREVLKRRLLDATRGDSPSGLQVVGPRRIGKTMLLDWLWEAWRAESKPGPLHLRVRCQGVTETSPVGLYLAVVDALRREDRELACMLQPEPPCGASEAGARLIQLVRDLGELGQALVLLLDEFDHLVGSPAFDEGFVGQLRVIEQERNAALVVTTRAPLGEVCHVRLKSSPLFNVLPQVRVEPFTLPEAHEALECWLGPVEKPVVTQCFAESGGWPMVLAMLAAELGDDRSLQAAQRASADLSEHLAGDLRVLLAAAEARTPGAERVFRTICLGKCSSGDLKSAAVESLKRQGLVRSDGAHLAPAWRCASRILAEMPDYDRLEPVLAGAPLTWDEWRRLAAARRGLVAAQPRVELALDRLLCARDALNALQDSRNLAEALLHVVGPALPAICFPRDTTPQPFLARTDKGARLAHLREAAREGGCDPLLAWEIQVLDGAGNVGAHHGGHTPTDGEVGPLLSLAVQAVGRLT